MMALWIDEGGLAGVVDSRFLAGARISQGGFWTWLPGNVLTTYARRSL